MFQLCVQTFAPIHFYPHSGDDCNGIVDAELLWLEGCLLLVLVELRQAKFQQMLQQRQQEDESKVSGCGLAALLLMLPSSFD